MAGKSWTRKEIEAALKGQRVRTARADSHAYTILSAARKWDGQPVSGDLRQDMVRGRLIAAMAKGVTAKQISTWPLTYWGQPMTEQVAKGAAALLQNWVDVVRQAQTPSCVAEQPMLIPPPQREERPKPTLRDLLARVERAEAELAAAKAALKDAL
jgi:hypothetical protein